MDWAATLLREAQTKPVVRIRDLASKYRLSAGAVTNALRRQATRGLLEKVADGVYLNRLAASITATDLVNELVPESYISLGTALAEWGLTSQNPSVVTCVTASRGRKIRAGTSANIVYRKISHDLFCGFVEKKSRYGRYKIAEPEKALLDWIYFHLKDGLPVQFDEVHFSNLSRSRLVAYAKKFPATVMQTLFLPLLEGEISGLKP
jgi:predicted transcriptional regulator of viral defense system